MNLHQGRIAEPVELLIFDCDGVLIDSEPVAIGSLARALLSAGAVVSVADVHRRFIGLPEDQIRQICIDEFGLLDIDRVLASWRLEIYDEFKRSLRPMDGMPALVRSLPVARCVASNSTTERLRLSLGLFDDLWTQFAPHVFSADMVERPKPAPDLFLFCARTFGSAPARCVVIDDNVPGIVGAVAAGMTAIGFVDPNDPRPGRRHTLEKAGAAYVAEGAAELAAILETLVPEAAVP
jgi:HAD superfamily hydrolase (TIGR01509 family)